MEKITKTDIDNLLQTYLKRKVYEIEQVKSQPPNEVWRFKTDVRYYYIKISLDHIPFYTEKWVIEHLAEKNVRVPRPVIYDDSEITFQYPFFVITAIDGQPFSTLSLAKSEQAFIITRAGKDLARMHHIHTRGFGWCSNELSRKYRIVCGYDDDLQTVLHNALHEHLPLLCNANIITNSEAEWIKTYIASHPSVHSLKQGRLVHGDYDLLHIFAAKYGYSGMIDFGNKMSMDPVWDIANFHMLHPGLSEYLIKGWREEIDIDLSDPKLFHEKIDVFSLIIAIVKSSWLIHHNFQKAKPYITYLQRYIHPHQPINRNFLDIDFLE